MHLRKIKAHEPIFTRRHSRTAVFLYIAVAAVAGLVFGSSPLVWDLLHGMDGMVADGSPSLRAGSGQGFDRGGGTPLSSSSGSQAHEEYGVGNDSFSHHMFPDKRRPRLLFQTASYTMDQFHGLQKTMDCMRDICNAGWDVTIVLQTASGFDEHHERYKELKERLYCVDKNAYIPLHIQTFKKIGFGLNSRHRLYLQEHLLDHDYFSFAEEDMLLTLSHLRAVVEFETTMKMAFPKTWLRYTPGFIRYEDSLTDTERVSWEYMPEKTYVVDMGLKSRELGKYVVTLNHNQAIYVFSREQLQDLEHRCGFITDVGQNPFYRQLRKAMDAKWNYISVGVSEWSSSFQQVLQCGLRRLTPVGETEGGGSTLLRNNNRWSNFMIHHSVNKAQTRRLRKELLSQSAWDQVIQEKSASPITLEKAYELVWEQYNLGGIDTAKFTTGDGRKSVWDWKMPPDEAQ